MVDGFLMFVNAMNKIKNWKNRKPAACFQPESVIPPWETGSAVREELLKVEFPFTNQRMAFSLLKIKNGDHLWYQIHVTVLTVEHYDGH